MRKTLGLPYLDGVVEGKGGRHDGKVGQIKEMIDTPAQA